MQDEINRGVYERVEQQWCAELPGGKVALELGGGIGTVTRVLTERHARVVSVEANGQLAEHWQRNTDGRAELRLGMVGGDRLTISREEWWKSSGSTEPTTALGPSRESRVAQLHLSDLVRELEPVAIMCDVEGSEYPTLALVARDGLLAGVADVIVELHPGLWSADEETRGRYDEALRVAMACAGFDVVRETKADGWPIGTAHPLGISHVWWRRRR